MYFLYINKNSHLLPEESHKIYTITSNPFPLRYPNSTFLPLLPFPLLLHIFLLLLLIFLIHYLLLHVFHILLHPTLLHPIILVIYPRQIHGIILGLGFRASFRAIMNEGAVRAQLAETWFRESGPF